MSLTSKTRAAMSHEELEAKEKEKNVIGLLSLLTNAVMHNSYILVSCKNYKKLFERDKEVYTVHIDDRGEVERCYQLNSSATASFIQTRLRNRGICISVAQLRRTRTRLGHKKTTTKYCHTIRDVNTIARVEFCEKMLRPNTTFSDCVFTDECAVQIDCSTKFCYVKPGEQYSRMRSRSKHPAKIRIRGGISRRGRTSLVILPGTTRIDSDLYCKMIGKIYVPFNRNVFNGLSYLL
ncbi:hypothetical protein Q1695_000508 [Nippostrongylus brasiliensis]|nr:hypothetical protein Q1695_000508 [Nippostrongylus brasiliensis]